MKRAALYDLPAETLDGDEVSLDAYRGQVTLVVNTASQCGFTSQYSDLQALHTEYEGRGFSVLGFPSDDFGGQEFATSGEVREFCENTFQVTFPLFAITNVKSGPDQSPVYEFLSKSSGSLPGWNFGKYLVGRDGKVLGFYASQVDPMGSELREAVESAL
ncbi:UNVERIFIED_CONTAM: hypothetical protein GTU68_043896 [Idotea baltica]|nr:hypothetical protein [Idotea baltica]